MFRPIPYRYSLRAAAVRRRTMLANVLGATALYGALAIVADSYAVAGGFDRFTAHFATLAAGAGAGCAWGALLSWARGTGR